jgi:hypothetical protein
MLTVSEINQRIDGLISQWQNNYLPLYNTVNFIRGEMAVRIFGSKASGVGKGGKNTAGTTLPTVKYSSTPIYVDVKGLPNKPAAFQFGKPKENETKGKAIESAYFPQGYGQLKDAIGRPPLEVSGYLKKAFSNFPQTVTGKEDPGDNPIIEEGENAKIVVPDEAEGQIEGLEKKYGTIFQMSKEEEKEFELLLAEEIAEAINKALE